MPGCTLISGETLSPGEARFSDDNRFKIAYQTDGNLVVYHLENEYRALWDWWKRPGRWDSRRGHSAGSCKMQTDGNLVVRNSAGDAVWASDTDGHAGAVAFMQTDGNFVIYDNAAKTRVLFATNSVFLPFIDWCIDLEYHNVTDQFNRHIRETHSYQTEAEAKAYAAYWANSFQAGDVIGYTVSQGRCV